MINLDWQTTKTLQISNKFGKKSIFEISVLLFMEDALDELDLLCIYDVLNQEKPMFTVLR